MLPTFSRAECRAEVYLPYAKFLASQDKFDEARAAYLRGGFPDRATKILEQLTHNAVMENRFSDAAFYYYQLSMEALKVRAGPARPAHPQIGTG